jgi:hypothetical protein
MLAGRQIIREDRWMGRQKDQKGKKTGRQTDR